MRARDSNIGALAGRDIANGSLSYGIAPRVGSRREHEEFNQAGRGMRAVYARGGLFLKTRIIHYRNCVRERDSDGALIGKIA